MTHNYGFSLMALPFYIDDELSETLFIKEKNSKKCWMKFEKTQNRDNYIELHDYS